MYTFIQHEMNICAREVPVFNNTDVHFSNKILHNNNKLGWKIFIVAYRQQ